MVGLLAFTDIDYFGGSFWPRKNCLMEDVYLAVTFSKIWLDLFFFFL